MLKVTGAESIFFLQPLPHSQVPKLLLKKVSFQEKQKEGPTPTYPHASLTPKQTSRLCLVAGALGLGCLLFQVVAKPVLTPGLLSGGGQFKQALSLCVQSRFMRADKDVTELCRVFIKTLFPGGMEKQRYLFYFF